MVHFDVVDNLNKLSDKENKNSKGLYLNCETLIAGNGDLKIMILNGSLLRSSTYEV